MTEYQSHVSAARAAEQLITEVFEIFRQHGLELCDVKEAFKQAGLWHSCYEIDQMVYGCDHPRAFERKFREMIYDQLHHQFLEGGPGVIIRALETAASKLKAAIPISAVLPTAPLEEQVFAADGGSNVLPFQFTEIAQEEENGVAAA